MEATLQDLVLAPVTGSEPLPETTHLTEFDSTGLLLRTLVLDTVLDRAADAGIGHQIPILDGPIGLHSP